MDTTVEHTELDQSVYTEDVELDQDVEDEGEDDLEVRVDAMARAFTVRLLAAVQVVRKATVTACVPVQAVIAGSPYLWARLWSPIASRLGKRSEERSTIAAGLSKARAAELAKLTDPVAIATKKASYAEADKAARKEGLDRLGSVMIGAGIAAFVGVPMAWRFIGPWVPAIAWSGIGLWCVAAMAHAPRPAQKATTSAPETPANAAAVPGQDDADEWIQDSPPEAVLWALIRHTAALTKQGTAAHLQAVLDEARKRGEMTDWTVSDLAEELASYGVPVAEQKKLTVGGRQYNRTAVLLSALPEADPAPVPAIVQPAAQRAA
jgi:hypothetical protein